MRKLFFILFAALAGFSTSAFASGKKVPQYILHNVEAPFKMEPIKEFVFPDRKFPVTKYGAKPGGTFDNTKAIAKAIDKCNRAGGGTVVIPEGVWLTGPIHLKSNVNLCLEEGAVVEFSDKCTDYLPAVQTSWEGMECFNYSPLVYAFACDNIAITGKGKLRPRIKGWTPWFKRPKEHLEASRQLYTWASTDVPVEQRQMAVGQNNMRPHLIHFNRCSNILLDGFSINGAPFWTIHLFLCDGGIARNLNVYAHNHNNDGIDLEMTKNVLVENCQFDQGDDAVVIKSGRNRDAWRVGQPTENVVVRNCKIIKGHCLLGIGSEMSGGVRNILMENCEAADSVFRMMYLKTNHRRGGFIHNVYMRNCHGTCAGRMFEIDTDVLYQWKDLVPTYETRMTDIHDIFMENCSIKRTDAIYEIKGDARKPVHDIYLRNINVGTVHKFINKSSNTFNVVSENVKYNNAAFCTRDTGVPMTHYLFAYFTGNETDAQQVCFAVSDNGLDWTPVNAGLPVISSDTVSLSGGVRDPHILRGSDGWFRMVATDMDWQKGKWSNHGIVMLRSRDLVNWEHHTVDFHVRYKNSPCGEVNAVWAPQTIFDPQERKYLVYFSLHSPKGGPYEKDAVFYCYANDDFSGLEGNPQRLFTYPDPTIDTDIVQTGDGMYHIFFNTWGNEGLQRRQFIGHSLRQPETWSLVPGRMQPNTIASEGSTAFPLIGSDEWILCYDCYRNGFFQFCKTRDMKLFTLERETQSTGKFTPRHGSVIQITQKEYELISKL